MYGIVYFASVSTWRSPRTRHGALRGQWSSEIIPAVQRRQKSTTVAMIPNWWDLRI